MCTDVEVIAQIDHKDPPNWIFLTLKVIVKVHRIVSQ